jgi:hypothetical protein
MLAEAPNPGFKWPVAVERTIAAPAQEVWEAISMSGNLESCHPFCARNPVKVWPGSNSQDEVHYLSGWVYERRFHQWIEGIGYDLEYPQNNGLSACASEYSRFDQVAATYASAPPHAQEISGLRCERFRVVCHPWRASSSEQIRQAPLVFGFGVDCRLIITPCPHLARSGHEFVCGELRALY